MKLRKIYSPCLVSVVHLFVIFGGFSGVCYSFLWMKSGLDIAVSKDLDREAIFSLKFESTAWFFPPTQRKIVHWSPFMVDLEKSSSFLLQFERFLLHHWSFQLCDADCCHPAYYGTAWINISNCSCITNATYQTGAQSKISLKIQSSPQTVHPSGKSHLSHSQERSLMLVSRCAVVCWMATGCVRKLKAPVVKHKLFELEQKAWRFFQADQERGPMDYLSLRWREKSSCELEFQQENGLAVQVFQNGSVQPWLCL